ncbi:hypothetical protein CEXT_329181 [Caerostris extrusa]|uniref:Uncharacterized protein n=1 Tax=Caerostris extrusa TaxID=172846 RepID=A0AAV4U817_CAEEX|nr:hypothetical protein CEXT_329181 [Caerostris extrusa]
MRRKFPRKINTTRAAIVVSLCENVDRPQARVPQDKNTAIDRTGAKLRRQKVPLLGCLFPSDSSPAREGLLAEDFQKGEIYFWFARKGEGEKRCSCEEQANGLRSLEFYSYFGMILPRSVCVLWQPRCSLAPLASCDAGLALGILECRGCAFGPPAELKRTRPHRRPSPIAPLRK